MIGRILFTLLSALTLAACNDDASPTTNSSTGGSTATLSGGTSATSTGQGGTASSQGGSPGSGGTSTTTTANFTDGLTGSPCQSDADCKSVSGVKNTCKLDWTGGYCTISCASFGECTRSGDLCLAVSAGATETICVRACDAGSICRPGYSCGGRSCFPSS